MNAPELSAAVRRPRVLLTAGIAAALAIGSFALPSAASADTPPTPPTLSMSAPTQIVNDNTSDPSQVFSFTVDNSAAGSAKLTNVVLQLALTLPTGLSCDKVDLAPVGTAPAFSFDQSCTAVVPFALNAGAKQTATYTVTVDGQVPATQTQPAHTITGTIGSTASLIQDTAGGTFDHVIATATGSSQLVDGSAPTLSTPAPAIVHTAYSAQVGNAGFPTVTTYAVYVKHVSNDNPPVVTYTKIFGPASTGTHDLNNGLVFDAKTGKITATAADLSITNITPPTYVIVANNGEGGSSVADPTTPIPTALHDVFSPAFSIPVEFSDVAPGSTFGPAIYTLAGDGTGGGVINGFADGTFRPTNTVNRQEFAEFAAGVLVNAHILSSSNLGACTGTTTSGFSDIPQSSPFCRAIKALHGLGVVNGQADGTFGGTQPVTRGAISALVYRTHEVILLDGGTPGQITDAQCPASGSGFADVPTSNIFCGDIAWMVANHITQGFPTTPPTFQPARGSARQESAAFIYRLEAAEGLLGS